MFEIELGVAVAIAQAFEQGVQGGRGNLDVGLAMKMLDQQGYGPTREGITQIAWIVFQGPDQSCLILGIGLGRGARTLVGPEGLQAALVEGLQPSEHGGAISPEEVADLVSAASLPGQQDGLRPEADLDGGRLSPQALDRDPLDAAQTTDKQWLGHDSGPP